MVTTASARARDSAPAKPAPLSARLRFGYASGSLVTGTFTTLPGLLLLPYLTDTLGVGAALAGAIVFVPKAWDAVLNPLVAGPATAPVPAGAPAARTSCSAASPWPWPSR